MKYHLNWDIQDGLLRPTDGRLVIFEGHAMISEGRARDHNDLLMALASRYRLNKHEVLSKALRFYWRPEKNNEITISPVRKWDEDWALKNILLLDAIVEALF